MKYKNKKKALILFSGGKDSVYVLSKAVEQGYEPILVSFVNPNNRLQLTDGVEIDSEILGKYLECFKFKKISVVLSDNYLTRDILVGLGDIIKAENPICIFTGDLDHPQGICKFLKQNLNIRVCIPAGEIYKKVGGLGYISHLIEEGFEVKIIGYREDVSTHVKVGDTLDIEYAKKLKESGIDCTAEDGEFQTLVTMCPVMSKNMTINNYIISKFKGRDSQNYTYHFISSKK